MWVEWAMCWFGNYGIMLVVTLRRPVRKSAWCLKKTTYGEDIPYTQKLMTTIYVQYIHSLEAHDECLKKRRHKRCRYFWLAASRWLINIPKNLIISDENSSTRFIDFPQDYPGVTVWYVSNHDGWSAANVLWCHNTRHWGTSANWEIKGYNARRAAVDAWYELLTDGAVELATKSKISLITHLGRKKTSPAVETATGHDPSSCTDWFCVKPTCRHARRHRPMGDLIPYDPRCWAAYEPSTAGPASTPAVRSATPNEYLDAISWSTDFREEDRREIAGYQEKCPSSIGINQGLWDGYGRRLVSSKSLRSEHRAYLSGEHGGFKLFSNILMGYRVAISDCARLLAR